MGFGSAWHWIVIGLVALLLFGGRLPEVARSLGRAFNEFKRGLKDVGDELKEDGTTGGDPPRPRLRQPESSISKSEAAAKEAVEPHQSDTH